MIFLLTISLSIQIWGAIMLMRRVHGALRNLFVAAGGTLSIGGIAALVVAERIYPLLSANEADAVLAALPLALAVTIVCGFLAVPVSRLTNPLGTLDPVLPVTILAFALGSTFIASIGWHKAANGLRDHSAPTSALGEIARVTPTWGIAGKGLILEMRLGGREERLTIHDEADLSPGQSVELSLRSGAHGWRWVENFVRK